MDFRTEIINSTRRRIEAEIEKNRIDAEILLSHAVGTPMTDVTGSFENIVERIAYLDSRLIALKHYFK
jgi:hypothetical protein